MLNLEIITTDNKNPRWTLNVFEINNITYTEKEIIDEICMLLEEKNNEKDEEMKEDELPFN